MARWRKDTTEDFGVYSEQTYFPASGAPPTTEESLKAWIKKTAIPQMERRRIPWPADVPRNPEELAQWWMRHQAPPIEHGPGSEEPRTLNCTTDRRGDDGGSSRWYCPYAERLKSTLAAFLMLSQKEREIVLAAADDGVFWRGDEVMRDAGPGLFIVMYDEILRMRELGLKAWMAKTLPEAKRKAEQIGNPGVLAGTSA